MRINDIGNGFEVLHQKQTTRTQETKSNGMFKSHKTTITEVDGQTETTKVKDGAGTHEYQTQYEYNEDGSRKIKSVRIKENLLYGPPNGTDNEFINDWYKEIDKILKNECYNIDKEHLYEFILSQKEQNLMSTILNNFFEVYQCCVDTDEQFTDQLRQIDDFIAMLNKNNLDRSAKRWVSKKKRFKKYRKNYKGIFDEGAFSSVLSFMIKEFGIDIDTEKENKSKAHKKTIKVKNKITNKIIKFDCIESCAEFFNTSIGTVKNWKNGATPRVFTDYKLLSH